MNGAPENSAPRVSVVLPVYNGERYLGEAIDSVLAQTFRNREIICVDDGSTDGSFDILQRYRDRVRIIRQENAGQGGARNTGANQARGEFLAFLDQDDRWYPQKLEREVACLEGDRQAVLVYSNSDRMDESGRVTQVGATLAERASALVSPLGRLIGEGLVLPSSLLVRREAFARAGGFDAHLRGFEDFDLSARLKQLGTFVFLPESGLCYRCHAAGFSRAGGMAVIQSRERFLLKMRTLYAGDVEKERLIRAMLAECYADWGMAELRAGNRRGGRGFLWRSIRHNPAKVRTYARLLRAWGIPG